MTTPIYPVHLDARLEHGLSRWLWLVKWVLVLPHYAVLFFLWLAFVGLSVVALVAILFTGRYPRAIFDFNVGVLRWSWRVAYYAYGALGTDRYPPFTLAEVADYPAHLSVDYPEHLSRGLVLVKWWLLALPHYLIVGLFVGGGLYLGTAVVGSENVVVWGGGLVTLLVLFAGLMLLFTGRYPVPVYDVVLGMNRWALRVAAYAGLMTDHYPPFRFDPGEHDPESNTLQHPRPSAPPPLPPRTPGQPDWTTGRAAALAFGILALLVGLGTGIVGTTLAVAEAQLRDDDGFVLLDVKPVETLGYAIASDPVDLTDATSSGGGFPEGLLGDAKVRVTGGGAKAIFVGVAATSDVQAYLDGVGHSVVRDLPLRGDSADPTYETTLGEAPRTAPGEAGFWLDQSSGTGPQEVAWPLATGSWTVVVMNANGTPGVTAEAEAGLTVPGLAWAVGVLLSIAGTLMIVALALLITALHRRRGTPAM